MSRILHIIPKLKNRKNGIGGGSGAAGPVGALAHCHPKKLIRAFCLRQDYAGNPARRDLQLESLAHIHSQRVVEARLRDEPDLNIAGPEFIVRKDGD